MSTDTRDAPFRFGDYVVEPEQNQLRRGGEVIAMERRNIDLLTYLVHNRERVISADELLEKLWPGRIVEESTIHRRISQVRKALGDQPRAPAYIRTVSKRGYQAIAATSFTITEKRIIKDRFVLDDSPMGADQFGSVYRALDLRQQEDGVTDPYIAVKVIHPEATKTARGLGLTETTNRNRNLVHPNIMNLYDFDRDGEVIFLTMPLLDGKPLDQLLTNPAETPSHETMLSILDQICAALAFSHQQGMVHGSLRPGTIFCTNDQVKVFDFGVPALRGGEADGNTNSNAYGSDFSDPRNYMSPEVRRGNSPTEADDLFALATIIKDLLPNEADERLANLITTATSPNREDRKVSIHDIQSAIKEKHSP